MKLHQRISPILFALILAACGGGNDDSAPPQKFQIASFYAAQNDMLEVIPFPGQGSDIPDFKEQTLRQIAHLSVGGNAIRIKFSNLFGKSPLTFDKVHVAKSLGSSAIDQSSDKPVMFSGAASVTIPIGGEIFSDEISFAPETSTDIAVSIYMKQATIRTAHRDSNMTSYVGAGDMTSSATIAGAVTSHSTYYMPEIDVIRDTKVNVVVAFGDSITDGVGSTPNVYADWPDKLSASLNAKFDVSVVNSGIGGNRWVKDNFGPCGLCRIDRDVINVSGATHAIFFLGINDIGVGYIYANVNNDPSELVTVKQITDSIQAAINKVKAKGIKVYLSTLTPCKPAPHCIVDGTVPGPTAGTTLPWNGEAMRVAVNAFIRSNTTVDGIIDFEKVVASPADPTLLRADWTVDNLHPNDVGYANMVLSLDPALFR